jgi:hypothetical protein
VDLSRGQMGFDHWSGHRSKVGFASTWINVNYYYIVVSSMIKVIVLLKSELLPITTCCWLPRFAHAENALSLRQLKNIVDYDNKRSPNRRKRPEWDTRNCQFIGAYEGPKRWGWRARAWKWWHVILSFLQTSLEKECCALLTRFWDITSVTVLHGAPLRLTPFGSIDDMYGQCIIKIHSSIICDCIFYMQRLSLKDDKL